MARLNLLPRLLSLMFVPLLACCAPSWAYGQDAQSIVKAAVAAELEANRTDKSTWIYRDHDTQLGKDEVAVVIETPQGNVQRVVSRFGKPLTADQRQTETIRIDQYVHDHATQAKKQKDVDKDGDSAKKLLEMLPQSFLWTVTSETPEYISLSFKPNPQFEPPTMESRVFSVMEGEMVVSREQHRIRTLKGKLTQDVKIGFGLLGKLNQGGTFEVERRELAPHIWQITEERVHIGGKALLFHTIGQQEDEVKTGFKPSTAKTLADAAELLQGEK